MAETSSLPGGSSPKLERPGDIVAKWFQGEKSVDRNGVQTKQPPLQLSAPNRRREAQGMDVAYLHCTPPRSAVIGKGNKSCSQQPWLSNRSQAVSIPSSGRQEQIDTRCSFCQSRSMDLLVDRLNKIQASLDEQMPIVKRYIVNHGEDMETVVKREFYTHQQKLNFDIQRIEGALDVLVSENVSCMSADRDKDWLSSSQNFRLKSTDNQQTVEEGEWLAMNETHREAAQTKKTAAPTVEDHAWSNTQSQSAGSVGTLRSKVTLAEDVDVCAYDAGQSSCARSVSGQLSENGQHHRGGLATEWRLMKQHCLRMERGERSKSKIKRYFLHQSQRLKEWNLKPKSFAVRLIDSAMFATTVVFMILANAVWMGYETNERIRFVLAHPSLPDNKSWHHIDNTFSALFAIELIFRIVALKQAFWLRHDWLFNFYDLIVVIASLAEVLTVNTLASVFRTMRFLRVIRVMRVVRVARFFHGLRVVGGAVAAGVVQVFWLLVMVLFIIFMFSILFMQLIVAFVDTNHEDAKRKLSSHWGTLGEAMFSLAMAVSGGIPWGTLAYGLDEISWTCRFLLAAYVFSIVFGFFGVIVGVFVDKTLELKSRDHNIAVHKERSLTRTFFVELRRLFEDDGLGLADNAVLDWQAFDSHLERTDVQMFLQSHNIDVVEARELFKILDHEGVGAIRLQDFVHGCQRIKGPAKRLDIVSICEQMQFLRCKQQETQDHQKTLEYHLTSLSKGLRKELVELRVDVAEMDRRNRLLGAMPAQSRKSVSRASISRASLSRLTSTESFE